MHLKSKPPILFVSPYTEDPEKNIKAICEDWWSVTRATEPPQLVVVKKSLRQSLESWTEFVWRISWKNSSRNLEQFLELQLQEIPLELRVYSIVNFDSK